MGKLGIRQVGLLIALVVILVDQLVKLWVTTSFGLDYEGAQHEILPFFRFTLTHNVGVALGLFPADGAVARWGLVAFLGAITLAVGWWLRRETNRGDAQALGLVLGGAIGNLLDRARLGYVVDYADLHFGEFRPFLIFNIADACITIGVLLLLARALLTKEPKAAAEVQEGAEA